MPLEFSPVISTYSNKHQSLKIRLKVMADGQAQLEDLGMVDVAPAIERELRSTITKWVKSMRFKPEQIAGQAVATELEWPLELTREPSGTRHANVDVANDPTCKLARSGSAGPRSINSPLKRKDGSPDAAAPSG